MKNSKHKFTIILLLGLIVFFHIFNNIFFLSIFPLAEGKDSYAHITAFNNFSQII
jgi:hypothetical protein